MNSPSSFIPLAVFLSLSLHIVSGCGPLQNFGEGLYSNLMWTKTGIVPNKLAQTPPSALSIVYNGKDIWPNETVTTEDMISRPTLSWATEPGALYTIMQVDFGIERLEGLQFFHWLITNVPAGNSVILGDEVKSYVAPFYFLVNAEGTGLVTDTSSQAGHDILTLVYKQSSGRVDMSAEESIECNPDSFNGRITDHVTIAEKYNLELVAGNFFWTTYTEATNAYLCYSGKCSGAPFPIPLPGINDGPECSL